MKKFSEKMAAAAGFIAATIGFSLPIFAGELYVEKNYISAGGSSGGTISLLADETFSWRDKKNCIITPATYKPSQTTQIKVKPGTPFEHKVIIGEITSKSEGKYTVKDEFWYYKLVSARASQIIEIGDINYGNKTYPIRFSVDVRYEPKDLPVKAIGKPVISYKNKVIAKKWSSIGSFIVENKEIACSAGTGTEKFVAEWKVKDETKVTDEEVLGPAWMSIVVGGKVEFPIQSDFIPIATELR